MDEDPLQIFDGFAIAKAKVGVPTTFIVMVFVPVQPAVLVPTTVYVVVVVGETTTDVPDSAPGFQL